MSVWRKLAIAGTVCLALSFGLVVVGVFTSGTLAPVLASVGLSAVGPLLLLVALIGFLVTRSGSRT